VHEKVLEMGSLCEIAEALRSGGQDLMAHVEGVCDQLDAREPEVQALIPDPDRRARLLADVRRLLEKYPDPAARPALFGVLVGVKDLFHVDGFVTRAGSDLPPDLFAGAEASVVTTLKRHGALILGKTVATEFAFSDPGPTRNPHNPAHTPGGSSSGSAAAVAAGYCPLALGTQTIGSIARPASYCGVVGYKPSCGRIPADGCVPFSHSVDHVGFFVPDVSSVGMVCERLVPDWKPLEESVPLPATLKIGVPSGMYLNQAEPEMRAMFDQVLEQMAVAGHDVQFIDLFPDWSTIVETHYDLIGAEMAAFHAPWYEECRDRYRPGSRELIERGQRVDAASLQQARVGQSELRDRVHTQMEERGLDCLLTPSATGPAPEGLDYTGNPRMNLPWSYTGLPTITVPATQTRKGLPMGVQWVGRFGGDEELLSILMPLG
jgi:Asp-tRNA(Asn)/Glu-tRNA(Gln) amidotransferase A subunit family amidase